MVKYLKIPNATAGFVKRISGFTEQHLVEDLYKYVFGEIDVKNPSDKKLLNLRISELPLVKDEERYGSMLRVLQSLHGSFLQKESRAKLFNNIQKQDWQKNSQALDQNFYPSLQHYLSSISLFLVLPEYIKKFDEEIEKVNLSTFRKKDYFPKEFNHWLVSHVADELALLIEDKFLSKSTPKKINDKVAEFDKRTAAIDDKRPIFLERKREFERNNYQSNPQWYKLFDDCEVDGFKFRCLCNEAELAKEAQEVSHCAGGYGHRCISGIRHLVSMTGPNGERATLRLDKDGSKVGGVSFGEVVVLDKKSSSNKIEEVARSFANDVSENKIKISSKLGATDANYSVSEMLGFDQNDERSCEQIFVACRDAGALPTTAQTFDEFKKEIGLDDYLSKKIPQHIVLSSNNDVAPPAIAARIAERVKDFGPRENAPRWD